MTPEQRAPAANRSPDDPHGTEVQASLAPANDVVGEIEALAKAARATVLRPDLSKGQKHRLIVELACRARQSAWPWAGREAVWRQVAAFLGEEPPPASSSDPVEKALVGLRRRGFAQCPECFRPILPDHIERQRILRWAAVDEALRREQGVRRAS